VTTHHELWERCLALKPKCNLQNLELAKIFYYFHGLYCLLIKFHVSILFQWWPVCMSLSTRSGWFSAQPWEGKSTLWGRLDELTTWNDEVLSEKPPRLWWSIFSCSWSYHHSLGLAWHAKLVFHWIGWSVKLELREVFITGSVIATRTIFDLLKDRKIDSKYPCNDSHANWEFCYVENFVRMVIVI